MLRRYVYPFSITFNIYCVYLDDLAADLSGRRVPRHVIPHAKSSRHLGFLPVDYSPRRWGTSSAAELPVKIDHSISKRFCSKDPLLLSRRLSFRTRLRPQGPRDPGESARPPIPAARPIRDRAVSRVKLPIDCGFIPSLGVPNVSEAESYCSVQKNGTASKCSRRPSMFCLRADRAH